LESVRSADVDRALEGLGDVPSDIYALVERYVGRTRITASDADSLLASLAPVAFDRVARTLAGGVAAPQEAVVSDADELSAPLVTERRGSQPDRVEAERDQVSSGSAGRADSDLVENVQLQVENVQLQQQPVPAFLQASTPDTGDGPLTRRMDARDVRIVSGTRKAAFSAGLLGADDLPDFPAIRPPTSGKDADEQPAVAADAATGAAVDQTDSFEILVDEEILEIEPDDAVFDDSPDES
jgi:hypothetical protein